jgi:hypothetical protein
MEHGVKIAAQSEDFEELWPLTLGLFDNFSPQIRIICINHAHYRYNNESCSKYRMELRVQIAA